MKETCLICGMVANVDPSLHTERYAHVPEVMRDGQRLRFDFCTYTFQRPEIAHDEYGRVNP